VTQGVNIQTFVQKFGVGKILFLYQVILKKCMLLFIKDALKTFIL